MKLEDLTPKQIDDVSYAMARAYAQAGTRAAAITRVHADHPIEPMVLEMMWRAIDASEDLDLN